MNLKIVENEVREVIVGVADTVKEILIVERLIDIVEEIIREALIDALDAIQNHHRDEETLETGEPSVLLGS